MVLMKNPQFLANQAQTLAILPNHEMVILAKFHNDRMKIVDFSLIPYSRASPIFYYSLSIILNEMTSQKNCDSFHFTVWKFQKFTLTLFWQKFRENNGFTKEITK